MIGQFVATSKFYLFGKKYYTQTGWEKAQKKYVIPDLLQDVTLDLTGKVYMITGANNGIGKEISKFLASKGATLYMVCRNLQRAQVCKDEIYESTKNPNIFLLIADCSLEADIRRIWKEFLAHQQSLRVSQPALHALVCNAGALLNERTYTSEGVEVMFASHLLFGTYLLGSLALPTLLATENARMVVVSSGGIYNTKFPSWDLVASSSNKPFDGQFVYAYAKRGQVLLCERWAEMYGDRMTFVTCHPGWCDTDGLDKAYGEQKEYFTPLRTLWQGAEGIAWLCIAPRQELTANGGFYLDRSLQVKHLSGLFTSEGSFSKNTIEEVDEMMRLLEEWGNGQRPSLDSIEAHRKKYLPLTASVSVAMDIPQYMGTWYVLASIPTSFERNAMNCIEYYTLDKTPSPAASSTSTATSTSPTTPATGSGSSDYRIQQKFSYCTRKRKNTTMVLHKEEVNMTGKVFNPPYNTHWKVEIKLVDFLGISIKSDYLVLDIADDYSYALIGVPDRSYLWVLTRAMPSTYDVFGQSVLSVYDLDIPTTTSELVEDLYVDRSSSLNFGWMSSVNMSESVDATTSMASRTIAKDEQYYEEKAILSRAVRVASVLGYDVRKVLRVPWKLK